MSDKPKIVNIEKIERTDINGEERYVYTLMDEIIAAHHPHLEMAKIVLAWHKGWNEDADGRIKLGTCKKVGDIDRDLHGYDFIITLNEPFWDAASDQQQRALMDHELTHAQVQLDENGVEKEDEKGRTVYRIRGHDVEEFTEVVKRHGIWKNDLQAFAKELKQKADNPLYADGMKIWA